MPASQLKIAMLSVHSCPVGSLGTKDTGGMNVYIRELAAELGRQGHLVDVYTRVHDPKDSQIVELGENARLIHLNAGGNEEMNKLMMYCYLPDFDCNVENFRKQNNLQYDLVFSHYWLSGWAGTVLQQWWRVPHMVMFHTLGAVKNSIGIGEDDPDLRIEKERELVKNCQRIIASTAREKEELINRYGASPETVSVVPCGVDLELFKPLDKALARQQIGFSDDNLILFVGRIEPLKGVDRLLRAMPHVLNGKKTRLMIIGGDSQDAYVDDLRKLSVKLRLNNSVDFHGLVKHEQLPYFYNAADVCVLPSYYESFGLVALESLACGTPVIANDVGDLRNIIRQGEDGFVLTDNAPEHLAEKISRLISDRHEDVAGNVRQSVQKYGWSNIAGAITGEFRSAIAGYPRR